MSRDRQACFVNWFCCSYLYINTKEIDFNRFFTFLNDLRIFDRSKFFLVTRFSVTSLLVTRYFVTLFSNTLNELFMVFVLSNRQTKSSVNRHCRWFCILETERTGSGECLLCHWSLFKQNDLNTKKTFYEIAKQENLVLYHFALKLCLSDEAG